MPRVSVIMPAYNAEKYIGAAVESVLTQIWQNWELIVINDGSTDSTAEAVKAHGDSRIVLISQENQGEAAARNAGLQRARGRYIGFLDADDLYLPNALSDHVSFLERHPELDVSFSDGYFCDALGRHLMRLSEHRPGPYTGDILEPLILSASVIAGIICTLARRSTIEQYHVRFDTSLTIGPDWDFWIELARHARFGYLDQPTCAYRIHDTNITRTTSHQKRRYDLARGRLKLLHADWFSRLSLPTRREFLWHLLVVLLEGELHEQEQVLQSAPVRDLPVREQAYLRRMVADSYISSRVHIGFASACLEEALTLLPTDHKSHLLLRLTRIHPLLGYIALRGWHSILRVREGLLHVGRCPRPVPIVLTSSDETQR